MTDDQIEEIADRIFWRIVGTIFWWFVLRTCGFGIVLSFTQSNWWMLAIQCYCVVRASFALFWKHRP